MNVMDTRATSALLYLDGVHVSFDGFHAINNLSLTVAPVFGLGLTSGGWGIGIPCCCRPPPVF